MGPYERNSLYVWVQKNVISLPIHYNKLPCPKTKENEIGTKDKTEPQHIHFRHNVKNHFPDMESLK